MIVNRILIYRCRNSIVNLTTKINNNLEIDITFEKIDNFLEIEKEQIVKLDIGDVFPLTIIRDRYNGAYSKGMFTAWNIQNKNLPIEIDGGDNGCQRFWKTQRKINDTIIGLGDSPELAVKDLLIQINK